MRPSIFTNIVRKEDSYTQLLCNLMKRDERFRGQILTLLLSEDSSKQIQADHIQTQKQLKGYGRPDIFIEANELCVLVEVKTELRRPIDAKQECSVDQDVDGYVKYLVEVQQCKLMRWLVYLIPQDWVYRPKLETNIELALSQYQSIQIRRVLWEDVLSEIARSDIYGRDVLIEEFRLLLADRFGPITFVEGGEIEMLFSNDTAMRAQVVWKLDRLIGEITKKAAESYGKDYIEVTKLKHKQDEWGCYLRKNSRENAYLLFFGCWIEFWQKEGCPLCLCIDNDWEKESPGLKKAFTDACKGEMISFGSEEKWTVCKIPSEDLKNPDAPRQIWQRIQPVFERLKQLVSYAPDLQHISGSSE